MTQVEIGTFPPNEALGKDTDHIVVRILENKYVRIDVERLDFRKKRLKIFQDGKGDLIVEYDNKRVVDERVKE